MELKRIQYSTALLAKKVGFNDENLESLTQALLQQWLRVEHNIIVYVEYDFDYTKTNYRGVIRSLNKEGIPQYVFTLEYSSYTSGIQKVETVLTNYRYTDKDYATYEEALEEALVIGLNLLKDGTI
jgi:hypothetical protein